MVFAENFVQVAYSAIQKNDSVVATSYLAASINWTMTILVLFAFVGGFLLFYLWWNQKKRQENINKAADKVLIEFGMKNGHVKFVLCDEHKGEITIDENKGKKTYDGYIKAPHDIGNTENYYILEDHGYIIDYPFGKPPAQQTQIMLYHFNENDPTPKFPRHPEQWDTDRYAILTSRLVELSKEETNLQAIVAEVSGALKPFMTAAKMLALIPQIRLLLFIALGAIVIAIFVEYMNMGGINTIKSFIIGVPVPTK